MTQEEIDIKYRALCPKCHNAFDTRTGYKYNGRLICKECKDELNFTTLEDYIRPKKELHW